MIAQKLAVACLAWVACVLPQYRVTIASDMGMYTSLLLTMPDETDHALWPTTTFTFYLNHGENFALRLGAQVRGGYAQYNFFFHAPETARVRDEETIDVFFSPKAFFKRQTIHSPLKLVLLAPDSPKPYVFEPEIEERATKRRCIQAQE